MLRNTMFIHSSILLLFFFNSIAAASSYNSSSSDLCRRPQSLALLQFKKNLLSINDSSYEYRCQERLGSAYHPKMINWNTATDCCRWDGVTCNPFTGDIIALDLSCAMIAGIIHPNATLFRLPKLQALNLAFNSFYPSSLPSEIGKFSNTLTHLNISFSGFSGQIPSEISLLPKLVSLDFSGNQFTSRIEPHVFNNLFRNSTRLEQLSLADVNISSELPTNFSQYTSLKSIDLRNTGLRGKLPREIFNLPYLLELRLSGNLALTGSLPELNGSNSNSNSLPLKWLSLSSTGLSGKIPVSFGYQFESLDILLLSDCAFVGSLPESLGNLKNLTTLGLSNNMLNGTLPSSLFTLGLLDYIDLSYNRLSGRIPSELFSLRSLRTLYLGYNQLVGQIDVAPPPFPQTFQQLVSLTRLDLSFNNFTGVWDLGTLFSNLKHLLKFAISYSGLSVITNNTTNQYVNRDFSYLLMASCNINVFPESLRGMKNLNKLDLSNNKIHGHVPEWAKEIGGNQLYHLNLSHNFITGLPQFQSDGLWFLYLKSNLIRGPFPPSICNMTQLKILDLSNNSFGGVIPHCFGKLNQFLSFVDLGNNRFNGTIPNILGDSQQLNGLILNQNQFDGEVPSSLSTCLSLKVLDFGNNHLTGTFPMWLANLPELQVLVLKSNKFHGPIRSSSMIQHPFPMLRILDLSHNGFVGHLPEEYFRYFTGMRNVVKTSTKPEYMQIFREDYYSVTIVMKGVSLLFTKISVAYTFIDLSNNRFEGEILDVVGSLYSLKGLNLSHNSLRGQVPRALGNLLELESLDLSFNQLTGEIPQSLADLTSLAFLSVSHNNLSGHIPRGSQFDTFLENSFEGNPELCGFPLHKTCEHPPGSQEEADEDSESGFTWKMVMLGYGCGTPVGLVIGCLMLCTRRPKWFHEFVEAQEHRISRWQNKRIYA